jgi:hypothetical protein
MTTFPQRASKNPKLPHDMRIRPSAMNIIPSELKHDATLTADIDVNRFGKRFWAELSAQQTSRNPKLPHDVCIRPSA